MPESGTTQAFHHPRRVVKRPENFHGAKHSPKSEPAQELFEKIGGLAEGFPPAILYRAIGQLS
jgi:hypothetical protein